VKDDQFNTQAILQTMKNNAPNPATVPGRSSLARADLFIMGGAEK